MVQEGGEVVKHNALGAISYLESKPAEIFLVASQQGEITLSLYVKSKNLSK